MLSTIIWIYTIYIMLKLYIATMQIGFIAFEKKKDPVLMGKGRYTVAGNYAIAKERLGMAEMIMDLLLFAFWVTKGFAWLQSLVGIEDTVLSAVLFLFGFFGINFIVMLPFELYGKFKIDEEFGFNKMTLPMYVMDTIKSTLIFVVLGGAAFALLAWIISSFQNWWIWGFVLMFTIALAANILMPFFMGLFNKFTPLDEGELRTAIEEMMTKVGLNSEGIFVMDASKRDGKLNAFFGGLGKSKRVVLFDTLLEKLSDKELLAVLGHELGHFKHGDIWKNIGLMAVLLFAGFSIFGNLPDSLFIQMGTPPNAGVKIAILLLLLPLLSFVFTPVMSYVSQHNEYAADAFGSQMGGKENLVSALLKLVTENKSFPKAHPLVIFFYHTHPPVLERLKELGFDATKVDLDAKLPSGGIFTFVDQDKA